MNKISVLITGAGGAGTIAIIESLKKIGNYHIVAVDANPYAYGFRIADKSYWVPMGDSEEFSYRMVEILEKEKLDYIIPLVDEEIMKLWKVHGRAKMLCPVSAFCEIALDKYLTHLALKNFGLPTPKTYLNSDFEWSGFPVIIKPKCGHGSKNQSIIIDPYQLSYFSNDDHFIIQEKISGKEFTVSVVVGLDGNLLSVVPKGVIDKRGITFVGITREVPQITELCSKIVRELNPMGPFNVQLMMDKDNKPWIFEINPRYSTTVALTIASGVNEVDAIIRREEGEKLDIPLKFTPNLMMNRYYTQEYIPESEWKFA